MRLTIIILSKDYREAVFLVMQKKKGWWVPSKTILPLKVWCQSGLSGAVDDLEVPQFSSSSWA